MFEVIIKFANLLFVKLFFCYRTFEIILVSSAAQESGGKETK